MPDAQVEELETTAVFCIDLGVWADQAGVLNSRPHNYLIVY
jgi:hypothetical protein